MRVFCSTYTETLIQLTVQIYRNIFLIHKRNRFGKSDHSRVSVILTIVNTRAILTDGCRVFFKYSVLLIPKLLIFY
jgi:hypothetical protein